MTSADGEAETLSPAGCAESRLQTLEIRLSLPESFAGVIGRYHSKLDRRKLRAIGHKHLMPFRLAVTGRELIGKRLI